MQNPLHIKSNFFVEVFLENWKTGKFDRRLRSLFRSLRFPDSLNLENELEKTGKNGPVLFAFNHVAFFPVSSS